MLKENLINVRKNKPLVHCLTNYVTVNDVANIILSSGASPVMADELSDAKEIAEFSSAIYINIGTLNGRTLISMKEVAKIGKERGIPVVLDPVGAGATSIRTNFAKELLEEGLIDIVRGNLSEMKVLIENKGGAIGVDADSDDFIRDENLKTVAAFIKKFAKTFRVIAVATGEIDVVSDGEKTFAVKNGHSSMSKITGTGCQLGALIAVYIGAYYMNEKVDMSQRIFAIITALVHMGLAGELGFERMESLEGNSTLRNRIIDAIEYIDETMLSHRGRVTELVI